MYSRLRYVLAGIPSLQNSINLLSEKMTVYELLKQAIEHKQKISALYDGHLRELCPHALGRKGNVEQCLAYQCGGMTSKGPVVPHSQNNWRCLTVSKLQDVKIQDGNWHSADNHSKPSTCLDSIDVEVAY